MGLALSALPASAMAQQIDVNPPIPNVLLLLDNSGSMEREIDGTAPEDSSANACNCTTAGCTFASPPAQANRWGTVQQALTGQLANGYNCISMPRTSGSNFITEYSINGTAPYDFNYYLPFHRMVAQDTSVSPAVPCVIAPGTLPGGATGQGVGSARSSNASVTADAFFSGDVVARQPSQLTSTSATCTFAQLPNGAIDSMTTLVRFGLMTFDNDPSAGTGVTGTSTTLKVGSSPFTGMWSYFPGWNGVGTSSPASGLPAQCVTGAQSYQVGSRNPAAPPWEGRMVGFPTGTTTQAQNNLNVQDVVNSSRPYGETPIAGMLTAAQYYFLTDPTGPYQTDAYVQGGCRQENIILLTDGVPNEDLRPDCCPATNGDTLLGCGGNPSAGSPAGQCPFYGPEVIASNLFTNTVGSNVVTYVIGFAMPTFNNNGVTTTCASLVTNGVLASQCVNPATTDADYACCKLEQIAVSGGSSQAYFADSPGDLQAALGAILARIASQATTRAVPAYSPVVTNVLASTTTPNQDVFYASFSPSPGEPWAGDVQRSRFFCGTSSSSSGSGSGSSSSGATSSTVFNASQGDDFAQDLNSSSGFTRTFIAFQPDLTHFTTNPSAAAGMSLRPFIAATPPDGVTTYGITTYSGTPGNVVPNIQPGTIAGIATTTSPQGCAYTPNNALGTQYLTTAQCRDRDLDFDFAVPAASFSGPSNFTFTSRSGDAFGDVYHGTPAIVGPPGSLLQDPSYVAFQQTWSNNVKCGTSVSGGLKPRPTTVYVPTNDGLLHAFWADETTLENNEQWAMLMPGAYQTLNSTYPSNHQPMLDGAPIVKDVVWDRNATVSTSNTSSAWHTTLVAGYGPSAPGYYAVDVTDPCPAIAGVGGPAFRWQIAGMPAGNYPIFGKYSATPAITTLFMDPGDGVQRDIGVAILPGGWDGPPSSNVACGRQTKAASDYSQPLSTSGYQARSSVRCWGANSLKTDYVDGRSVAIVRLDTGEIIRVLAQPTDYGATAYASDTLKAKSRILAAPFDSPITGTPVVYPSDVGADATKFFIGDADGTIWRVDVSSPNPNNWKATLFLDAYNTTVDTSSTSAVDGQPFEVTPVISLDSAGNLVLNAATGTTEQFDTNGTYYLYSATEKVQTASSVTALQAFVNWVLTPTSSPSPLRAGERVAGPMTVFNGSLYFATYYAGNPAVTSCTSGDARIWGMDFDTPSATASSGLCTHCNGGVLTLNTTTGYTDVGLTFPGKVVPGVSVQATPGCGAVNTGADLYVGNTQHLSTSSFSAGAFSLVGLVGGTTGANGMSANPFSIGLPTPTSPTLIDSWASVLE